MNRAPTAVRVRACGKINLTLRVLGVHADGYHELRTTFQSLALHDTLTFRAVRGPFAIEADTATCPTDRTNLVWKAAESLWRRAGRDGSLRGVRVEIRKRLPVEAGLGGGSADAVATLRALRTLWRIPASDVELAALGRALGADVPFFLEGGTVLGLERGDLLFPLQDAEPAWVVLARPDFGISTKDAYRWWDEAARGGPGAPGPRRSVGEWTNDLQAPVVARHPRIATLIRALRRSGARFSAMSGSGSAVFGLFQDRALAEAAAATLAAPGTRTWLTRTTSRREHRRVTAPRVL